MSILHKRERFNRNCVASSRGAYVMHAHKQQLTENHSTSTSFFAAVKKSVSVYYVKCWGQLIPVDAERAAMYPEDMVVIK